MVFECCISKTITLVYPVLPNHNSKVKLQNEKGCTNEVAHPNEPRIAVKILVKVMVISVVTSFIDFIFISFIKQISKLANIHDYKLYEHGNIIASSALYIILLLRRNHGNERKERKKKHPGPWPLFINYNHSQVDQKHKHLIDSNQLSSIRYVILAATSM